MKKVGIVTIDSFNCGNRLQNYALQQALSDLGFDVYTIPRKKPVGSLAGRISVKFKKMARKVLGTRGGLYARFNDKYIRYYSGYATADTYSPDLDKQFDFFVAGSDQVWNPIYADLPHKPVGMCDLLSFARPEQKVSYAASFGVDEMPENKKNVFRDALKDFTAISVREEAGVEIIKELLGAEAALVVDPVLLLTDSQWKRIERKPKGNVGSYILVYALDNKGVLLQREIDKVGEKQIIDVMGVDKNGRNVPYGPQEFLYLIDHADEVWTNSFHATAFSLIFHKPLRTFPREGLDMSSRIVSLANLTGLQECFSEDGILVVDENANFNEIDLKINAAKNMSLGFIKNALDE